MIRLHWSPEILAELSRAILKERPDKDPNLRHFPPDQPALVEPPITPMHPDTFLVRLLSTDGAGVLPIVVRLRRRLKAPSMSVADYTASLAKSRLTQTAEPLKHLLPL